VVGRLVQHQEIGPPGHQQRQVGPGALARRQGADRPQHVVRPEAELREQGPRLGLVLAGRVPERLHQGGVAGERPAHLVDLADHHAAPEPGPAGRQRQPTQQRGQQGRLARAVGAGDREALSPAYGEIDRPEPETTEVDHRRREPGHLVRPAGRRVEREPELPGVARVVHRLEPVQLSHQSASGGAA